MTIRKDWVGQAIEGRFPLLAWLGGSEETGVFLTELEGKRKAAIKLIPAEAGRAQAYFDRWKRAAALSHPSLLRIFNAGESQIDGTPLVYVVTEYAEEILANIIPERALTVDETREMVGQVLGAVAYLHGKGLVHGHLKPSNILVVDNQLKISSDRIQPAGKLDPSRGALALYDAPELAQGTITSSADIWSLGVTLVETLTQRPPVWDRASKNDPNVPASIPSPFGGVARACLKVDPQRRCTLNDVEARLDPARPVAPPPVAPRSKPAAVPATPVADRAARVNTPSAAKPSAAKADDTGSPANVRLIALIAAVVVLILVFAVWHMRSRKNEPTQQAPAQTQSVPAPSAAAPQPSSPPTAQNSQSPATQQGPTADGAVVDRVMPDVPAGASRTIHGTIKIKIRVDVDANGAVSNATVEPPHASHYFTNLAVQSAKGWKFKPKQVNGQPVASTWVLHFEFRRSGSNVIPVEANR